MCHTNKKNATIFIIRYTAVQQKSEARYASTIM